MPAKRIMAAAVAWARKYFVAASTARGKWGRAISGTIARELISRPIQARSQWELEKVTVEPSPRARSKVENISGLISEGRGLTYILGVWALQLD